MTQLEMPIDVIGYPNLLVSVSREQIPRSKESRTGLLGGIHLDGQELLDGIVGLRAHFSGVDILVVDGNGSQSGNGRRVCEEDVIGNPGPGWRKKTDTHSLDTRIWKTTEGIAKDGVLSTRVVAKEGIHRIIEANVQTLCPFCISMGKAVDTLGRWFQAWLVRTLELGVVTAVEFAFIDLAQAPHRWEDPPSSD